jgi:hypothetical protein
VNLRKLILFVVLALVLTAAPATARTHIQFFSSKTGTVPTECQQESAIVAPLLAQFHSLSWTWIIAVTRPLGTVKSFTLANMTPSAVF